MKNRTTKRKGISFHIKTGKFVQWKFSYEDAVATAVDSSMSLRKPSIVSVVAETLAAARWWRKAFYEEAMTPEEYARFKGPIEIFEIKAKRKS